MKKQNKRYTNVLYVDEHARLTELYYRWETTAQKTQSGRFDRLFQTKTFKRRWEHRLKIEHRFRLELRKILGDCTEFEFVTIRGHGKLVLWKAVTNK